MSSVTLRPIQFRDVERIRASYRAGHRAPLFVAPTGYGKTVVFAYICAGAVKLGSRVLILCHRVELIDQISAALTAQGVFHGFIAAGYPHIRGHQVYVASVFTLARRLHLFTPALIIVDEAHHTVAGTWSKILGAYPRARVLGVTATPCRTNGAGLDSHFDDLIVGPSYQELADVGFLTQLVTYAPPSVDTSGMHTRAGEYIQQEVVARADRPSVTGDCIEHYLKHCAGKRAIVFDVSVDAARRRAAAFREHGCSSEFIDGTLSRDIRAMAVSDFRAGRIQVLTSCDLVSEGFDLPAIEVGISLRPTQSLALWLQQTGRILRPMEGKSVAYLFDHTGNWQRHGLPTEARSWSLAGVVKNTDRAKPEQGVRVCPTCFAVSKGGAKKCASCGEVFPIQSRYVKEKEGDLGELTPEEVARQREIRHRAQTQGRAKSIESLIELYHARHPQGDPGKALRWATHILDARRAKGK
jgi:superfamily II DNA or RNA helicase